jgi:hypothetical protein
METILKYRIAFITVLFGAFGGALSLLLKVEDLKNYYPALAALIALLVSLLISFLIKGRWSVPFRNQLKVWATGLFILFIGATILHTYYVITRTFEYEDFDVTNRYVKGEYSNSALDYQRQYPNLTDQEMLFHYFEGSAGRDIYWKKDTVDKNVFALILTYSGVVLFFVACISLLAEVLATKYTKSSKKNYAPEPNGNT